MKGVINMISMNLAFLRNANQYSQEEIAEKIGVSRQTVAKWENGDTIPDLNHCIALASLYDVTIDDLVNHNSKKTGYAIPTKGKHIFGNVTIGERGQIVIPKKARNIFNFQPGDSLIILGDEQQGGLALVKTDDFLKMAKDILTIGGILNDCNQNKSSI